MNDRTGPIRLIAFDADDTLWVNEPAYLAAQARLAELLAPHATAEHVVQTLYQIDIRNLEVYGYGIKGFTLSMLETAARLSPSPLPPADIEAILNEGKRMLTAPIALFDRVQETLEALAASRTLMLITKGDLFEQELRIQRSGLAGYFSFTEIVSEKSEATYQRLLERHAVPPGQFVMVGNSLKSDILPVAAIGGRAVYIHCAETWEHEKVADADHTRYERLDHIGLLPEFIHKLENLEGESPRSSRLGG